MKKYMFLVVSLMLALHAYGGGDFSEFSSFSLAAAEDDPFADFGGGGDYVDYSTDLDYVAETDIQPQECRFYLTYKDSGKSNYDLLMDAEKVKDKISDSLKKIDKKKILIEMSSFNPEQYLGTLFKSQKEEIELQFRIIVKLDKDFWVNTKRITKVLDVINSVKKSERLDKKLIQGKVTYAVENVDPFISELMQDAEDKMHLIKKRILNVNKIPESDLIIKPVYGNIGASHQTLEKVILVLPYSFSYEIKGEKD